MNSFKNTGKLYLVATPIGNLGDISARAVETIKNSDIVAAEDTRHTGMLMKKLGLSPRLESYHEHNKASKGLYLTEQIRNGLNVALVSDAGMPCISDPGNDLVKLCTKENITVIVVPGPCAAVTAISGSDLDTSRFVFEGFIPSKGRERKSRIEETAYEKRTFIIYEAPHRIIKTLNELSAAGMGDRRITIAREITKFHEEFIRSTIDNAVEYFSSTKPKGEFVLVIEGKSEYDMRLLKLKNEKSGNNETRDKCELINETEEIYDRGIEDFISGQIQSGLSVNDIAKMTAIKFSIQKKNAYQIVLAVKNKSTFDK